MRPPSPSPVAPPRILSPQPGRAAQAPGAQAQDAEAPRAAPAWRRSTRAWPDAGRAPTPDQNARTALRPPSPQRAPSPLPMPQRIERGLHIGGVLEAHGRAGLEAAGITHIVNATVEHGNPFVGEFSYLHLPVRDTAAERLGPYFRPVADFVRAAREGGGEVLLHCQHGISRSAALALATMMILDGERLEPAFARLRGLRPEVEPRPEFLRELRALEQQLTGALTSTRALTFLDAPEAAAAWAGDASAAGTPRLVEAVLLLAAVSAAGILEMPERRRLQRDVLVSLAALGAAEREHAVHDALRAVLDAYAMHGPRAEQARAALVDTLVEAQRRTLLPPGAVPRHMEALRIDEDWQDWCIDHPLAGRYLGEMQRRCVALLEQLSPLPDGCLQDDGRMASVDLSHYARKEG